MRRRALAAVLLGLLVIAGRAEGQAGPDSLTLTLEQAVTRTLETSEEVGLALARQNLAESQVVQTRAGALPQIGASLSYNRTLASIFDGFSLGGPDEGEAGD